MSRPKILKMTPKQEHAAEAGEKLCARSMLLRCGVAEALKLGYPGPFDLEIALQVLQEAAHDEAEGRRLLRIAHTSNFAPKRRTR